MWRKECTQGPHCMGPFCLLCVPLLLPSIPACFSLWYLHAQPDLKTTKHIPSDIPPSEIPPWILFFIPLPRSS